MRESALLIDCIIRSYSTVYKTKPSEKLRRSVTKRNLHTTNYSVYGRILLLLYSCILRPSKAVRRYTAVVIDTRPSSFVAFASNTKPMLQTQSVCHVQSAYNSHGYGYDTLRTQSDTHSRLQRIWHKTRGLQAGPLRHVPTMREVCDCLPSEVPYTTRCSSL